MLLRWCFGQHSGLGPVQSEQVRKIPADGPWRAVTLVTANNRVFQARADAHLLAYFAETGEQRRDTVPGLGISVAPISYAADGRQWVVIRVSHYGLC